MGFRNNSFATVWEVESRNNRWTRLRINISKKDKDTGEYDNEFSGFVDVFGTAAAAKAAKLKARDRIKLLSVDVTNTYDKEKKVTYWNPKVFDFEMANAPTSNRNTNRVNEQAAYNGDNMYDGDDGELPF